MKSSKQFSRMAVLCIVIVLANIFFLMVAAEHIDAHTPVTSKYDYNRDVFPLLQNYCGSCHVQGGAAPMSLMTYSDAKPWAESIRDEVTAGRMPPWPVDPTCPPLKGSFPMSSRDIDVIVVWASGGTPQGNIEAKLPAVALNPQWKLGPPDLKVEMGEHTVPPSAIEETSEFSVATNLTDTKWVRAVDLMPGNASIVRDAIISIENGPVLALWQPGSDTMTAPRGVAFRMAQGSNIHLQIHYKKHFDQEQNAVSDKSAIGLYFTDPPSSGRELQSLEIAPLKARGDLDGSLTFTRTLPGAGRIVALRPMLDRAYESLNVDAITPFGADVPLLRLHGPRPQWFRRYWLQNPMELADGSKIMVRVMPLSNYSDEPKVTRRIPLEIALDYVSR